MPSKNPQGALLDILENIALARDFVAGLKFEQFKNDRKTVYATVLCLEIISEATRRLPYTIFERHPHIPWTDIKGAGNVYRHDYDDLAESIIWKTIQSSLSPLEETVKAEIARLKRLTN